MKLNTKAPIYCELQRGSFLRKMRKVLLGKIEFTELDFYKYGEIVKIPVVKTEVFFRYY